MADAPKRWLRPLLAILVVGASLVFLGRQMAPHWRDMSAQPPRLDATLLSLSMLAALPWFALRLRVWQQVMGQGGEDPGYRAALPLWSVREPQCETTSA